MDHLSKPVIVLISGKAGTGKTTTAKFIKDYLDKNTKYKSVIQPFASGLKMIAYAMGWDGSKDDKGRKLLQDLGAVGRKYNIDVWVNISINDLLLRKDGYPFDFILVDDWRFPNEYNTLKRSDSYQVVSVRLEAPDREILRGTELYFDVSETSLPNPGKNSPEFERRQDFDYDYVINNSGSKDQLKENVDVIITRILSKAHYWGKD